MNTNSKMKLFNQLWNEIDFIYHEVALKLGLSDSAMMVLYSVCNIGDECMLSDITHSSGISKQTVNSALRKLETEDIIFLEPVGLKKKKVCLTEKGKEFVKNTVYKVIEIENSIFDSWRDDEWEKFIELNQRFVTALRSKAKELD